VIDDQLNYLVREIRVGLERDPNTGEMNYIISRLLQILPSNTYSSLESKIGLLECCKLELYRRAVAPYEDIKIQENGDVYKEKQ